MQQMCGEKVFPDETLVITATSDGTFILFQNKSEIQRHLKSNFLFNFHQKLW